MLSLAGPLVSKLINELRTLLLTLGSGACLGGHSHGLTSMVTPPRQGSGSAPLVNEGRLSPGAPGTQISELPLMQVVWQLFSWVLTLFPVLPRVAVSQKSHRERSLEKFHRLRAPACALRAPSGHSFV